MPKHHLIMYLLFISKISVESQDCQTQIGKIGPFKGSTKKTLTVNLFILFCRFLLSGINGGLTWVEKAVKILQIDVENYK